MQYDYKIGLEWDMWLWCEFR